MVFCPFGLFGICSQMFKYHQEIGVDLPLIVCIFFKDGNPISLIVSGAALIRCGAILGKTLGQVPSVAVQIEFRYPILGYSLDIVAGRLLAMVKIIENTVGAGCFSVEKRAIATGHAPISAIIE